MRHTHRWFLRSLAACVPLAGLCLIAGPGSAASTAFASPVFASPVQAAATSAQLRAAAEIREALGNLTSSQASPASPAGPARRAPSAIRPLTTISASNWAGYTDISSVRNTYSSVGGSWNQPAITCPTASSFAIFWVGIDGMGSSTTEAAGTLAQCNTTGPPTYFTFWDMYPAPPVMVGSTVQPGDFITASVARSGTSYTLRLTDATHPTVITPALPNGFLINQTCAGCPAISIEWILGQPTPIDATASYLLANFHTWTVNNATATATTGTGTISTFAHDAISMVGSSRTLAQPGALSSSGNSFTTTWLASS